MFSDADTAGLACADCTALLEPCGCHAVKCEMVTDWSCLTSVNDKHAECLLDDEG